MYVRASNVVYYVCDAIKYKVNGKYKYLIYYIIYNEEKKL